LDQQFLHAFPVVLGQERVVEFTGDEFGTPMNRRWWWFIDGAIDIIAIASILSADPTVASSACRLYKARACPQAEVACVTSRLSRTDRPCSAYTLESRNRTLKRTSLSLAVL
jgi:hypothetical protein